MLKIGILGCGFACNNKLDERLNPWFNVAKELNIVFSFVSARFIEYEKLGIKQDNRITKNILLDYKNLGQLQYLECPETTLSEAEARDLALQHLLKENCDLTYLLDLSDEFYTEQQIKNIFNFINKEDNQYVAWFSTPMKNYIFDGTQQWVDGFSPPRCFKTVFGSSKLTRVYFDNDMEYTSGLGQKIDYKFLPTRQIPKHLINKGIKHITWTHENGKLKEKYQRQHFSNNLCSYKFNEKTQKLEFDIDGYYKKLNIPVPEVHADE